MPVNPNRVCLLKDGKATQGPVVYWMSRDQRINDNWALLFSQEQALQMRVPLVVVFCLVPEFLHATLRHYGFMLRGLEELVPPLAKKKITFHLLEGQPERLLPQFLDEHDASCLVTDFDPLSIKRSWKKAVSNAIAIPFYEVDAHNIVPCLHVSQKQEYGAYTLRPKILKALPEFLVPFPRLRTHPFPFVGKTKGVDWRLLTDRLPVDGSVGEVRWIIPGERAAGKALQKFLRCGLSDYAQKRNDPCLDGQSGLSPYLHFGQIAGQRVALAVMSSTPPKESRDAFLEELIIRRELSDNFCIYNMNYDSFGGFPAWAQKSLDEHRRDRREYRYSLTQFEQAATHDDLWNAAQKEMVISGKMHGYLRMYWAKKILEWTESPEEAMKIAIYLNDRYELDGRDPNGYAGIAWSIGGVHDRAWNERPVFGKIRYMSYNGSKSKFNIRTYIEKVNSL
jgi:deoxyribodipyrimidine photo-lyase